METHNRPATLSAAGNTEAGKERHVPALLGESLLAGGECQRARQERLVGFIESWMPDNHFEVRLVSNLFNADAALERLRVQEVRLLKQHEGDGVMGLLLAAGIETDIAGAIVAAWRQRGEDARREVQGIMDEHGFTAQDVVAATIGRRPDIFQPLGKMILAAQSALLVQQRSLERHQESRRRRAGRHVPKPTPREEQGRGGRAEDPRLGVPPSA